LRFRRVVDDDNLWRGYKYASTERVALDQMSEREEPDLDQVREAMRDHDERLREEAADEGGHEPVEDEDEDDRDEDDEARDH
jgi:hypothetical protein